MQGVRITETSNRYINDIEERLGKGDYAKSITEPATESPYPLWIYYDEIKMWQDFRWKNVGYIEDSSAFGLVRMDNNKIRIKN